MKTTDFSRLNAQSVQPVLNGLQQLLAGFQVLNSNIRGLHWNIKGREFFELHAEYETLYNTFSSKADELAERILALGGVPAHNYSDYLKLSPVAESETISKGDSGIELILQSVALLIEAERAVIKDAAQASDEATVTMLGDYLKEQEKLVWMLTAYLS